MASVFLCDSDLSCSGRRWDQDVDRDDGSDMLCRRWVPPGDNRVGGVGVARLGRQDDDGVHTSSSHATQEASDATMEGGIRGDDACWWFMFDIDRTDKQDTTTQRGGGPKQHQTVKARITRLGENDGERGKIN
jgi:hypothetical protein